jgi:hypothetical protein
VNEYRQYRYYCASSLGRTEFTKIHGEGLDRVLKEQADGTHPVELEQIHEYLGAVSDPLHA